MRCHLALKRLPVSKLLLVKARSEPRATRSQSDQILFVDCITDVEHFDNFTLDWLLLCKLFTPGKHQFTYSVLGCLSWTFSLRKI